MSNTGRTDMVQSARRFRLRRFVWWLVASIFFLPLFGFGLYWILLRPSPLDRREIFEGVFAEVLELEDPVAGAGRAMILELHWDTPGLEIFIRKPDQAGPRDPRVDYSLTLPSYEVMARGLSVFVNLTRYTPEARWRSIPGAKVASVETVVVDGGWTHIDQNSYLFWWDASMDFHAERSKPPRLEDLRRAVLGFGLQSIQIVEGEVQENSHSGWNESINSRTFVGVDPVKRIIWLFAFESVTPSFMAHFALQHGVYYGAQLDSGSSTNLIVGAGAEGLLPLTGIRGGRPIASYLGVRARPVSP